MLESDKKNWIIYSLITVNLAIIISMIIVTPIGMYVFYNEYIALSNNINGNFPLFMLGLPFFNLTNVDYLITFFTMSSIYLSLLLLIIVKEKDSLNRANRDKINLEGTLSNRIIIIIKTKKNNGNI